MADDQASVTGTGNDKVVVKLSAADVKAAAQQENPHAITSGTTFSAQSLEIDPDGRATTQLVLEEKPTPQPKQQPIAKRSTLRQLQKIRPQHGKLAKKPAAAIATKNTPQPKAKQTAPKPATSVVARPIQLHVDPRRREEAISKLSSDELAEKGLINALKPDKVASLQPPRPKNYQAAMPRKMGNTPQPVMAELAQKGEQIAVAQPSPAEVIGGVVKKAVEMPKKQQRLAHAAINNTPTPYN